MTVGAKRRLEGSGAEMRVADIRQKFRAASGAAPSKPEPKPARAPKKPDVDSETFVEDTPKQKSRGKEKLSEREVWLQRNSKQAGKSRSKTSGGASYFLFLILAMGGGGAYGLVAADMGSFELAAKHIAAAPHCETAKLVGLAPAARGEPGYWAHNDQTGAGVSCGD